MKQDDIKRAKHWALLISVTGIGLKWFDRTIDFLKENRISWPEFWVNHHGVWAKIGYDKRIVKSINKLKKEYTYQTYSSWLQSKQIRVVARFDPAYPALLKEIDSPPPVLFVRGQLSLVNQCPVAVVGTRRMTSYGRRATRKIVQELVWHQVSVISGFMYGVDVTAQRSAFEAGGTTAGVLACGFDHLTPSYHRSFYNDWLATDRACFISEYPPWFKAQAGTFRQRNRIVAGLSLGVVVIEAAPKSGTQITVRLGLDYGRDIFAVPGPITSQFSEGTRLMVNRGAMLVNSGHEVFENLSAHNWGLSSRYLSQVKEQDKQQDSGQKFEPSNQLEDRIVSQLQLSAMGTDDLSNELERDVVEVSTSLSSLEVAGLVIRKGGLWQLI